jgi:hypothetical protein
VSESLETVLSEVVGKQLVGELLTIIDTAFADKEQRNGAKSLVRQACQKCFTSLNSRLKPEGGTATKS